MTKEWIDLTAADGKRLKMYAARPEGKPKGAVVVIQEIFGVNDHIRSICDRLAALGYVAGAPALFDRITPDYEAGYSADDVEAGKAMMTKFDFPACFLDLDAAIAALKPIGKVSVVGFCLGGSLAYKVATTNPDIVASVGYYGGRIAEFADAAPLCPVILHYGEQDHGIPPENIDTVMRKQPGLPIYTYPAGHGFNCDARSAYEPQSAKLAWERTMALIDEVSV
jgi:carboxymethylenebutenolidase